MSILVRDESMKPSSLKIMSGQREEVTDYQPFLEELARTSHSSDQLAVLAMLDGRAASELRRLVSPERRRELGAYFTSTRLADQLAEPLAGATSSSLRIVDTACGAGDLLLAAARAVVKSRTERETAVDFIGVDLVSAFVKAADDRMSLLRRQSNWTFSHSVRCGEGSEADELVDATHLLLNPPFTSVIAPAHCTWGSGLVNGAAVFLLANLGRCGEGVSVHAILPEVLRCGVRYSKWRAEVEQLLKVESVEPVGRFDTWTDVDVFVLRGTTSRVGSACDGRSAWVPESKGATVGDRYSVSVGSVVHYRDPQVDEAVPYLTSKNFPSWSVVADVAGERRFGGRLEEPPFVAIPRTSRPGDLNRARAAVVVTEWPIAVDNHLLVARPFDGKLTACHELLQQLRDPKTTEWLDQVIRCRHLTVGSVRSLPWWGPA